jgi:hypothetical protein
VHITSSRCKIFCLLNCSKIGYNFIIPYARYTLPYTVYLWYGTHWYTHKAHTLRCKTIDTCYHGPYNMIHPSSTSTIHALRTCLFFSMRATLQRYTPYNDTRWNKTFGENETNNYFVINLRNCLFAKVVNSIIFQDTRQQ